MARKSTEFKVVFHLPSDGEGVDLLAKTIGEVHTKVIREIISKKISDVNQKNRVIIGLHKKLLKGQNNISSASDKNELEAGR